MAKPSIKDSRYDRRSNAAYILSFQIYDPKEALDADYRREVIRYNREHQLRLLSAIPQKYLSQTVASHVEAEKTALLHYRDWDSYSSGWAYIASPMSADQMLRASDEDILGLFRILTDHTGSDHPTRPHQGGTVQAGREFGLFAKSAPSRAASIIQKLSTGPHDIAIGEALRALPESDFQSDALFELILELSENGKSSESFREDCAVAIRGVSVSA